MSCLFSNFAEIRDSTVYTFHVVNDIVEIAKRDSSFLKCTTQITFRRIFLNMSVKTDVCFGLIKKK
jgi:hypothetical protein